MQIVILANHESEKKHPLTLTRPKCMLKIVDGTLLEILLKQIKGIGGTKDIVLVVGNKKEMIKDYFGESLNGFNINYVESEEKSDVNKYKDVLKEAVKGEIIILDGGGLYSKGLLKKSLENKGFSLDSDADLEKLEGDLINIEFPWNYLEANVLMLNKFQGWGNKGVVEKGAVIKGNVYIGKGSVIKSGSYIEGPAYIGEGCVIGPHAYIRENTVIMNNVNTRGEIYDTVIMDNTTAKHNCYIGHSVIGSGVNIGAGTITSDYRHDSGEHVTLINDKKVESRRTKLGAFIGDDARTGIGTLIYPGRKIWPGKSTLPGEVVKKDIK